MKGKAVDGAIAGFHGCAAISNIRTLLSWARTSVSMIGFRFTIYNFYRGFLEDIGETHGDDAARNLGLALGFGGIILGVWGVRSVLMPQALSTITAIDLALSWLILLLLLGLAVRAMLHFHRHSDLPLPRPRRNR